MNFANNTMTLNSTANGSVRRIRTPHPHDVLSGRGGGINGHVSLKCASRLTRDTRYIWPFYSLSRSLAPLIFSGRKRSISRVGASKKNRLQLGTF